MTYHNGKPIGNSGNNIIRQANRIQTFMISSVLSSNKDVVALIPVQTMINQDLYHMTKEVVKMYLFVPIGLSASFLIIML